MTCATLLMLSDGAEISGVLLSPWLGNNPRRRFVHTTLLVVTVAGVASRNGHRTKKIGSGGLTVKDFFVQWYALLP